MGDQTNHALRARHSYFISRGPNCTAHSENCCKSEVNVVLQKEYVLPTCSKKHDIHGRTSFRSLGEYYKKYEHDEVPVKDSNHEDPTVGDKGSLTNSELDKLEMKIFKNMSQELQTDDNSMTSLDSNIKFFRTTVQEIFDNFYASMRDFEIYKKRFNEILAKNKEDALADMEEFIKDMIQHIMSSDTLVSNESKKSNDFATISFKDKETHISNFDDSSSFDTTTISTGENLHSVVEAYKNDNYLTDTTFDDNSSKSKGRSNKEEIFNIYLLSGNPCVQIKMNERNLLSEINIKEPIQSPPEGKPVASAENIERLAAKKLELKKYVEQLQDYNAPDIEIPVKVSYAKKNIHLNEDFSHDRDNDKSFMSKLCNFLCRKFRKTA